MSKLRSQLNSLTSATARTSDDVMVENRDYRQDHMAVHGHHGDQVAAESLLPQTAPISKTAPAPARIESQKELADIKSTLQNLAQQLAQQGANNTDLNVKPAVCNARDIDPETIAGSLSRSLRDQMATEIDKMRGELGALQQNANEANNRAVLDDIQRISEGIHDLQSRQAVSPDQFGEMANDMRGLHRDIRSLSERPQPQIDSREITRSIQHSYDEIAKRLDGLGTSPQANHFEAMSEKLEVIKNSISTGDPQLLSRIEEQMHGLSSGISALSEVNANGQDGVIDTLLPEYFEGLDRRLDEITRAVLASAPAANNAGDEAAFDRIEARIASLAKSVENISPDNSNEIPAGQENFSQLFALPEQMQSKLAGLEQQLALINNSGNAGPGIGEEFGGQLASLTQKIDLLQSNNATAGNIDQLDDHNSVQINEKLESLALTLERAINSGDGSVGQLEGRISELSNRIEQAVSADSSEQQNRALNDARIFEELQALAARVETLDASNTGAAPQGEQLSALESQISAISAQLQSVGGQPDLSSIENRLGGIEEQFATSREVAIEAATQAAQQAVFLNKGENQSTAISDLAEDLKNLTHSSSELKGRSLETFDAVRDSLSMILDRINSIEVRIANEELEPGLSQPIQPAHDEIHNAEMVDAARSYASSLAQQETIAESHEVSTHMASAREETHDKSDEFVDTNHGAPGQLPQVNAPSLDLQHLPPVENSLAEGAALAGDDMPLEPGSGAPDLAGDLTASDGPNMDALMRQAKENKRKDTLEDEQQNPTDFIAAARRAAQAAARDETTNIAPEKKEKKKKAKFKIGKLSNFGKKPVMVGAAVLLAAAIAIPAVNYFSAPKPMQISRDENPPAEIATSRSDEGAMLSEDMVDDVAQQNDIDLADDAPATPVQQMLTDNAAEKTDQLGVTASMSRENNAPTTRSFDSDQPVARKLTEAPLPPKEVGPVSLRQAAARGDAKAQFEVGRRYTNGINGKPDFKEAVVWYERSANSSYAPAQYRLGNFYEKGHGITSDVDEAASWYNMAAEQGNALAMHNLAVINAMGVLEGGANMVEASTWFKNAAEHGVKDSQVNLGIVYAKGMGIDADLAQAYKWFAIAAKAGDKDAAQKRDTVAKQMRPDQLKLARGEVELWRPKELSPEANTVNIPAEWSAVPDVTASLTDAQMIQKTQAELTKLGFKPGPADGLMGAKTVRAIKEFQARAGIAVNGKVTPDLVKALENAGNKT